MRNRKKIKASPPPALRPFIPWPKEHLHHRLFSPGGEGDGPGSDGMRVAFSPPQPFSAALPCFIEPCPGLQPFRNSTLLWSSPWPQLLQEIPPSVPWALHRLQVGSAPGRFCGAAGDPCCKPGSPACAQRDPALGHRHCYTVLWKGLHLASSEITQICTR